jgi:hypothetical protein
VHCFLANWFLKIEMLGRYLFQLYPAKKTHSPLKLKKNCIYSVLKN